MQIEYINLLNTERYSNNLRITSLHKIPKSDRNRVCWNIRMWKAKDLRFQIPCDKAIEMTKRYTKHTTSSFFNLKHMHRYQSLSISLRRYPSLSIAFHCCRLLSIVGDNLSIAIHFYPSLSIAFHFYPLLSISVNSIPLLSFFI